MKSLSALFITTALLLCGASIIQAAQVGLADWCVNVNGDSATACNGAGSGSSSISLSSFDTTLEPGSNTLGYITVLLNVGAGQYVSFYADYDVDDDSVGSFTDSASVHGTLPPGVSFELDDPNTSNIFTLFSTNSLSNANNVGTPAGPSNTCCDVAVALALGLDVPAGGQTITFAVTSTAPTSGFYIEQTNSVTHNSIYLQEFAGPITASPEPSGLTLGVVLLSALMLFSPRRSN